MRSLWLYSVLIIKHWQCNTMLLSLCATAPWGTMSMVWRSSDQILEIKNLKWQLCHSVSKQVAWSVTSGCQSSSSRFVKTCHLLTEVHDDYIKLQLALTQLDDHKRHNNLQTARKTHVISAVTDAAPLVYFPSPKALKNGHCLFLPRVASIC